MRLSVRPNDAKSLLPPPRPLAIITNAEFLLNTAISYYTTTDLPPLLNYIPGDEHDVLLFSVCWPGEQQSS